MNTLHHLDYTAIALYMLLMAVLGVLLGRFVKDAGDYFKGGSVIPWAVGAVSNFMSMFSTFIFVAYAGIAYEFGLVSLTLLWCTVPPMVLAALFLAKRWRRANIMTPVEFLERRFNPATRQVFTWSGLFFRLLDNMVRLYAMGIFLSAVTPLSLKIAILLAGTGVLAYTIAGGLWAVVITDTVQFFFLMLTTLILIPLSIRMAGGIDTVVTTIPDHFNWFNGPKGSFWFLLAYYVMVLIKYNGNWGFIQRFYSVKDERSAQKLGWMSACFFLAFPIIFLLPSMVAAVALPGLENGEMAYAAISAAALPPGILGLMIAAMFVATMSSLDGEYNVMAGVVTLDVYARLIRPRATEKQRLLVGRVATTGIGILVMLGALYIDRFGGAFEANKLFTGLFAIPMTIPLIGGIVSKRIRPAGAFASILVGLVTGLFFNAHPQYSWETATLIQVMLCFAVMLVSAAWPARDPAYLSRTTAFFDQLNRPLTAAEKPSLSAKTGIGMRKVVVFSLAATGVLFVLMSIPSLSVLGGQLSLGAGVICLIGGALAWPYGKNERMKEKQKKHTYESVEK
ncbi:sodium:solute symporter family transporter [Parapedobacter tibetensis]|uniref:sodium:solute symporter family transporter n=1 Tax=Parapedobacter tibetensis TaxID=2972951 RepID=UPI00214D486C|nr:hypothetical protein [Parapedobacter tibetensis]